MTYIPYILLVEGGIPNMTVKVRKVGNSYTLTIPTDAMETMRLVDGQELGVRSSAHLLEYYPLYIRPHKIDWSAYENTGVDVRDSMKPDEYVRKLRDNDR